MLTSLIAADVSSKRGLAQMPDRVALAIRPAGAIAGPVASAPAVTSDGASTAIRQPFESRSRTADRRDAARARWPYRGDVERGDFSAPCRHADLPSKGLSEGSQVERQDFPDAIKEGCGEVPGVLNLMGERMRAEP